MPQIDTVTFLSQLFWITVGFFTFYSIVISGVVPRIARILKVRAKKVALDSDQRNDSSSEINTVLASYDTLLLNSSTNSRNLVQKTDDVSKGWITSDLENIFSDNLGRGTKSCLRANADLVAKKSALFNLMK
jgi:hypothetical protein